jgi:hypothetical protein
MGDKTKLRISKSQEASPSPFFLLGEEGELWGFFWILMFPMYSHQVMGTQALNQNLSTNNDRHNSGIISFITLISPTTTQKKCGIGNLVGWETGNAYDVPPS